MKLLCAEVAFSWEIFWEKKIPNLRGLGIGIPKKSHSKATSDYVTRLFTMRQIRVFQPFRRDCAELRDRSDKMSGRGFSIINNI